jgi:hypothetical protein
VLHLVVELLFQRHKAGPAAWSYYRLATCVNINLKFETVERARYLSRDTYLFYSGNFVLYVVSARTIQTLAALAVHHFSDLISLCKIKS